MYTCLFSRRRIKPVPLLRLPRLHVSGPIPEELCKLTALEQLFVGDNDLEGKHTAVYVWADFDTDDERAKKSNGV